MKNFKSLILSVALALTAGIGFVGCKTTAEGTKEIDPVAFSILKSSMAGVAFEYARSSDAAQYADEFKAVSAGIDIVLSDSKNTNDIVAFVEGFKVDELKSPYARIALRTLADLYLAYLDQRVVEEISKYEQAKELLEAVKNGLRDGLAANPALQ